jgi:hypothetical protein
MGGLYLDKITGEWHFDVIEIDETHLVKMKAAENKKARPLINQDVWVIGGVSRYTKKIFMIRVPDRKIPTVDWIIKNYILPGTIIMTDSFKSYVNITERHNFE